MALFVQGHACAQNPDGALSQSEIESLRDASYIPLDKTKVYEKILDSREQEIEDLMKRPRRPGFAEDMHDALDQFGQIADEFNDNLDEFAKNHRDLRKELPKLLKAVDRWTTVSRSPPENESYSIVKKIALDNLKDTQELATQILADEEMYFKAHPEAAKAEKERMAKRE